MSDPEQWMQDAGRDCYDLYEKFAYDEVDDISEAEFAEIIAKHYAGQREKVDELVRKVKFVIPHLRYMAVRDDCADCVICETQLRTALKALEEKG